MMASPGDSRGARRSMVSCTNAAGSSGRAVRSGVLEQAWAQRLFLRAYAQYKAALEARDADRLASAHRRETAGGERLASWVA